MNDTSGSQTPGTESYAPRESGTGAIPSPKFLQAVGRLLDTEGEEISNTDTDGDEMESVPETHSGLEGGYGDRATGFGSGVLYDPGMSRQYR